MIYLGMMGGMPGMGGAGMMMGGMGGGMGMGMQGTNKIIKYFYPITLSSKFLCFSIKISQMQF